MRKGSLLRQLKIGLLVGVVLMPPSVAQAQWTVHDPPQYVLQVKKRLEEANRWLQTYENAMQQLTTLGGILKTTEDLMVKQRNAISTMSSIGQTVRGMYQLKDQFEAIVISRMRAFKSIESRLRNGIFDPEADMRDFDEYLRNSIGRSSQGLGASSTARWTGFKGHSAKLIKTKSSLNYCTTPATVASKHNLQHSSPLIKEQSCAHANSGDHRYPFCTLLPFLSA